MTYMTFIILATLFGIGGALVFGLRAKSSASLYLLAVFAVPMGFSWRYLFGITSSYSWQAISLLTVAFGLTYGLYYLGKGMNT